MNFYLLNEKGFQFTKTQFNRTLSVDGSKTSGHLDELYNLRLELTVGVGSTSSQESADKAG